MLLCNFHVVGFALAYSGELSRCGCGLVVTLFWHLPLLLLKYAGLFAVGESVILRQVALKLMSL